MYKLTYVFNVAKIFDFIFQEVVKSLGKIQSYKIVPDRCPTFSVVYKIFEKNVKFGQK